MAPGHSRAPARLAAIVGSLALFALALLAPTGRAADLDKLDTSLKIIPADAAFYSSSLRIKEQIDAIAKSKAWATLWNLPAVQMGWAQLEKEYKSGNLAAARALLEQEDNKELLALLADAGSHEIFVYGGESWSGFLELAQRVANNAQYGPVKAQLTGNANGRNEQELQIRAVLLTLQQNSDLIRLPDFVIGGKVTDTRRIDHQLTRLEALLDMGAAHEPKLRGRYKRVKINDGTFLTLTLDGALVPWDDIPWKTVEDKPGEFAPLIAKLKATTLTFSVGHQHGYLMVSIGGTTEQLAKVGGRGPKLSGRPEVKPLDKFADRKLTSLEYVSKDLLQKLARGQDYDSLKEMAVLALPKINATEEQQKRILKDLDDLAREMKVNTADVGAVFGLSFLSPRGYESYAYNYSKNTGIDGSKPLTLLNHVGGNPILATVGRVKVTGESYATFSKWVKVFYGHADDIVQANIVGDAKEEYLKATQRLLPLFKRIDETTAKLLIPALADGQFGLVVDAKWTSKQWLKNAPATEKPMPMIEIAIVLGVSDAAKLHKAMATYLNTLNDMIGAVRSLNGAAGAIGDFRIPDPQSVKKGATTLFFYPLPEEAGLDKQLVPTAALSDSVAMLTLSHGMAERLLKSTPLKVDGGPLANTKRPLAGAVYFNWPALVDAATPWIELGANHAMEEFFGPDAPKKQRDDILSQVRTVFKVLKVYRGFTAATYLEDGVIVTHGETVIQDLEK